jgi:DNA-3-methyladenine glycosylase II
MKRSTATRPTSATQISTQIELPPGFRPEDILAFHRRDAQEVAERVEGDTLSKGLAWRGKPAVLKIGIEPGNAHVVFSLDGEEAPDAREVEALARRMLGLTQGIEAFEAHYRDHPQLGALVVRNAGLRIPLSASPFEALTWAVTGQQISVVVAVSLRRKLIQAANLQHSSGLLCYPDAHTVSRLDFEQLRAAGFSRTDAAQSRRQRRRR